MKDLPVRADDGTRPLEKRRQIAARGESDTGQALVDGARDVFRQIGYQDATVEDILSAAGVSRATFYAYFRNKRSAFLHVAMGLREQLYISAGKRFPDAGDYERVVLGNSAYLALWAEESRIYADFFRLSLTDEEVTAIYLAHQARFESRMAQHFGRLIATREEAGEYDVTLRASAMFSMAEQFAYRFFTGKVGDGQYEFIDAVKTISEIAYRANHGRTPPSDFPYAEYGLDNPHVREHLEDFRARMA